jgi:hypothetical protein
VAGESRPSVSSVGVSGGPGRGSGLCVTRWRTSEIRYVTVLALWGARRGAGCGRSVGPAPTGVGLGSAVTAGDRWRFSAIGGGAPRRQTGPTATSCRCLRRGAAGDVVRSQRGRVPGDRSRVQRSGCAVSPCAPVRQSPVGRHRTRYLPGRPSWSTPGAPPAPSPRAPAGDPIRRTTPAGGRDASGS